MPAGLSPARRALPFPLRSALVPLATIGSLALGGLLYLMEGTRHLAAPGMLGALALLGAPVVLRTLRGLLRGEFAADVVAMLAIVTAVALREPVAGLVIVLMQTGGELLERYAEGRASNAVRELEAAAPRIAHRVAGTAIEDVEVDRLRPGDRILVRPGEMVAADGTVAEGSSSLDTSRISGEPLPERVGPGSNVRSGVVNLEGPILVSVTAAAGASLYARIVELVRTAQAEKAPIQRLADRWAVWFTPVTLVACGVAWWLSGDAGRVLAVLVVATPCPLLLATPVAVIGGINRAARRQVIVRNGTALEQLARVDAVVFDKTGTLTIGRPAVARVRAFGTTDAGEMLRLAAAVEVGSGHLLARSVVDAAVAGGRPTAIARDVREHAGRGVTGLVDGARVTVGSLSLIRELHPASIPTIEAQAAAAGLPREGLRAFVVAEPSGPPEHALPATDPGAVLTGAIEFADVPRPGLPPFFARLHAMGLRRLVLLSGDHAANVEPIARALGIDEARGDLLPEDKVAAVRAMEREGHRVLMVGDGTNDAPALSAATVGVALAAHGGGISAEAADVVLLADDVTRVADAVVIARRAVGVARQSIIAGLVLSGLAMVIAALGHIPPTLGAFIQEGIDVAVILNALRAARG